METLQELSQGPPTLTFVEIDDVIQTLPWESPDHPYHEWILSG